MELINKTDANLNIALIAKNKTKSDAQKALMGRVLFMMDNMPTIEAIPKDQYEARLNADMVAMLTEIQLEIEEKSIIDYDEDLYDGGECVISISEINEIIQEKINALRGNEDDNC